MALQPIRNILGGKFGVDEGCTFMTILVPNCPILILRQIYPQSVTVSMTEKRTDTMTKGAWVQEHWPAELDVMNTESLTGSFFLLDGSVVRSRQSNALLRLLLESDGLTSSRRLQPFRRYTEPSLTTMELERLYRINGAEFEADGQIRNYSPVNIRFMNFVFVGYFTSFNIRHNVERIHQYQVSFQFKVQRLIVQPEFSLVNGSEAIRIR